MLKPTTYKDQRRYEEEEQMNRIIQEIWELRDDDSQDSQKVEVEAVIIGNDVVRKTKATVEEVAVEVVIDDESNNLEDSSCPQIGGMQYNEFDKTYLLSGPK